MAMRAPAAAPAQATSDAPAGSSSGASGGAGAPPSTAERSEGQAPGPGAAARSVGTEGGARSSSAPASKTQDGGATGGRATAVDGAPIGTTRDDGGTAKAESTPAPKATKGWLNRLFGRFDEGDQEQQAEQPDEAAKAGADKDKAAPPPKSTREQELEAELTAARQKIEGLTREDVALVDELAKTDDPWAVQEKAAKRATNRRAADMATQVGTVISLVGRGFDAQVLSALVDAVPEDRRDAVKDAGKARGYEGRRALVLAAVNAIAEHAKAEGEAGAAEALKKDPEFLKGVLRGRRSGAIELDLTPAMAAASSGVDMNARMRAAAGKPPSRNGTN